MAAAGQWLAAAAGQWLAALASDSARCPKIDLTAAARADWR
jgi:hypothetical protein